MAVALTASARACTMVKASAECGVINLAMMSLG